MSDFFISDQEARQSRTDAAQAGPAPPPSFFSQPFENVGADISAGVSRAGLGLNTALASGNRYLSGLGYLDFSGGPRVTDADPGWLTRYFEQRADEHMRDLQARTPDPATRSEAANLIGGLAGTLTTFFAGGAIGGGAGALTGATAAGFGFGRESEERLLEQGVDPETARRGAQIEGGFMGAMGLAPVAIPGRILTRALSGAAINAGLGVGMRGSMESYLNAQGYGEVAEQYRWLDPQAATIDAVLGAAFGAAFGRRASPRPRFNAATAEIEPREPRSAEEWLDDARAFAQDAEPDFAEAYARALIAEDLGAAEAAGVRALIEDDASAADLEAGRALASEYAQARLADDLRDSGALDAAFVTQDALHREVQTAPGIPADSNARRAHSQALRVAEEQAASDSPIEVRATQVEDAAFVPREDVEAMAADVEAARRALTERPPTLTAWVRRQGGISDDRGDVAGGAGDHKVRAFSRLVRPDGQPIDRLIEAAVAEGLFPNHRETLPTRQEFIDALNEDATGRITETTTADQFAARNAREILRYYESEGLDISLRGEALRVAVEQMQALRLQDALRQALEDNGFADRIADLEAEQQRARARGLDPDIMFSMGRRDALFARSAADGPRSTVESLSRAAELQFGVSWRALARAGFVDIVQSAKDVPREGFGDFPGVQAVHVRADKRTYFVADNISPAMLRGLVLHEIGVHHGLQDMLGKRGMNALYRQVDRLLAEGHPDIEVARYYAERFAAHPDHIPEETLAYLVENLADSPIVQSFLAKVRQWLVRTFGSSFGLQLTTDDIRALALASLRRVVNQAAREASEASPVYANDILMSREDDAGLRGVGREAYRPVDDQGNPVASETFPFGFRRMGPNSYRAEQFMPREPRFEWPDEGVSVRGMRRKVEEVPIEALTGTQIRVGDNFLNPERPRNPRMMNGKKSPFGDMPAIVQVGDDRFVIDGHNRIAEAAARGDTSVRVHVFDGRDLVGRRAVDEQPLSIRSPRIKPPPPPPPQAPDGGSGRALGAPLTRDRIIRETFRDVSTEGARREAASTLQPTITRQQGDELFRTYTIPAKGSPIRVRVESDGAEAGVFFEYENPAAPGRQLDDALRQVTRAIQRDMDLFGENSYHFSGETTAHRKVYEAMADSGAFSAGERYVLQRSEFGFPELRRRQGDRLATSSDERVPLALEGPDAQPPAVGSGDDFPLFSMGVDGAPRYSDVNDPAFVERVEDVRSRLENAGIAGRRTPSGPDQAGGGARQGDGREQQDGGEGAVQGQRSQSRRARDGGEPGLEREDVRAILDVSGLRLRSRRDLNNGEFMATVDAPFPLSTRQGKAALGAENIPGEPAANIRFDIKGPVGRRYVQLKWTGVADSLKGTGLGSWLYRTLLDWAFDEGYVAVLSDSDVSPDAQKMYVALQRRGYKVDRSADAREAPDGRLFTDNFSPVYRVTRGESAPARDHGPAPGAGWMIDGVPMAERAKPALERLQAMRDAEAERAKLSPEEQALQDKPDAMFSFGPRRELPARALMENARAEEAAAREMRASMEAAARCGARHAAEAAGRGASFVTMNAARGASGVLAGQALGLTTALPVGLLATPLLAQNARLSLENSRRVAKQGNRALARSMGYAEPSDYIVPVEGIPLADLVSAADADLGDFAAQEAGVAAGPNPAGFNVPPEPASLTLDE